MSATPHYVYIIAHVREGRFVAPVKVGKTKNLASRISTLKTSSAYDIKLLHALAVPHPSIAAEIEAVFHEVNKARRLRGEWFDITPDDALRRLIVQFFYQLSERGVPVDIIPDVLEVSGAVAGAKLFQEIRTVH